MATAIDDRMVLGPVLEFLRELWALDHALQRSSKRMAAALGVTGPQRLVVRIVGRSPGISAGELARVMHVHPSTLTGVLARLESHGLVQREADSLDGRRSLFRLTANGRRIDASTAGSIEAAVARLMTTLRREDITVAGAVLAELTRILSGAIDDDAGRRDAPERRRVSVR